MKDKDDLTHISSFLTGLPKGPQEEFHIDWSENFDFDKMAAAIDAEANAPRWVTAIQKVSPKSGAFWYDYGARYNEKVMMQICPTKDPQGRRCCDVQLFTRRTIGDVVFSAWQEYNHWALENHK
jgi:hypothetical protein